jgi:mannan endo-1,6-alpha-mannosidase
MRTSSTRLGATALLAVAATAQSPYSIDTIDDIRASARTLAYDLMTYYHGNESGQVPGILPGPPPGGDYYWWEGGALWGTMIDYWYYTGDTTYNDNVIQSILHQTGEHRDFMPLNYTASLGNDDQAFWGMTALLGAEDKFPDPPSDQAQYLALAQAVFNTQAAPSRHDDTCGGGLRWQIPFTNQGYDYKNTIANGCFFNIGARLARYTGNETYANWAEETWDWLFSVGFVDAKTYAVYDGAHVDKNCTDINEAQFSYNCAVLAQGAAYMYNYTEGSDVWKDRTERMVNRCLDTFFPDGIAYEPSCEPYDHQCTTDMLSFKGYVARWLAISTQVAPFLRDTVLPVLRTSAEAAIKQCTGGETGRACGFRWSEGKYDDVYGTGAGQQMNVLGAVVSLLINGTSAQVTEQSGGTSKGDNNAGSNSDDFLGNLKPVTAGDQVGASFLTLLVLVAAIGTFGWMSMGG